MRTHPFKLIIFTWEWQAISEKSRVHAHNRYIYVYALYIVIIWTARPFISLEQPRLQGLPGGMQLMGGRRVLIIKGLPTTYQCAKKWEASEHRRTVLKASKLIKF